MNVRARARWERTRRDLDRMYTAVSEWLDVRRETDTREQYATQLDHVSSLLIGALESLAAEFDHVDCDLPVAELYEVCHQFDRRIVWVGRVWEFFRAKFDQREHPALATALHAADELVWSCYRPCFPNDVPISAPLPFIEFSLAPEAFPPELVPADLRGQAVDAEFLRAHLARLPIGVVRIPPVARTEAWTLGLLAHETGHHVQYALQPGRALVGAVRELVGGTVAAAGGSPGDEQRWSSWSEEAFADVFSVHLLGPWALWVIGELELRGRDFMTTRRPRYPAPAVRLALLAATARALGLDPEPGLRGFDPAAVLAGTPAMHDLGVVTNVATALTGPLPGCGQTLAEITRFRADEFAPKGTVAVLADDLRAGRDPALTASVRAPRVAAAALVAAYGQDLPAPASVGSAGLALITTYGPAGRRAATEQAIPENLGKGLADLLLTADPDLLED